MGNFARFRVPGEEAEDAGIGLDDPQQDIGLSRRMQVKLSGNNGERGDDLNFS